MRKLLLGSTALAVGGLASVPAMAQLNLTVSGYYRFDAAYVDETNTGNVGTPTLTNPAATTNLTTRSYDFSSRARLVFDATGTADNGLKYGARIRFHQGFGSFSFNELDQTYGFVQGSFGRVAFGDIESAGSQLRIYTPDTAGTGIANGTWSNFARGMTNRTQRLVNGAVGESVTGLTVPAGFGGFNLNRFGPNPGGSYFDDVLFGSTNGNSYSTKLVYTTTGINLYGFTFGVSYAPEIGNRGRNYDRNAIAPTTGPGTTFEDAISVALQYANTNIWNSIGAKAGFQYNWANSRNPNVKDLEAWMIGAQFTYAGFTLGGHYIDNGDSGSVTTAGLAAGSPGLFSGTPAGTTTLIPILFDSYQGWGVGAEYTMGPWTIGANWFTQYVNGIVTPVATPTGSPIADYKLQAYGLGASYLVAPGLTVGADVVHFEEDITKRSPIKDNSGTVVSVRTQVTF